MQKLWIMAMMIILIPSAFAWQTSTEIVTFDSPTLTFQYPATLADEIDVTRLTELDIPEAGNVEYNVFTLNGYDNMTRENYPTRPFITVYPIASDGLNEWGRQYIDADVESLQMILDEQPDPFHTEFWIPSLNAHSMPRLF